MFFTTQNIEHVGDAQSVDRPDSHFTVYPNSQLQQMFFPLPGKGSNINSILLAIWRIKAQWDLRDLTEAA